MIPSKLLNNFFLRKLSDCRLYIFWLSIFIWFAVFPAYTIETILPEIIVEEPAHGWTALKVIEVKGYVKNFDHIQEIEMVFNGNSRYIPLLEGRFYQKIVLGSGTNYIVLKAKNSRGLAVKNIKLMTNNSQMNLKVILSWDTNHTDVDLWVTDPNNERVYFSHPHSKIGGTLDIDITTGFGPETFTLPYAIPGRYLVQCQYYGGSKPTMVKVLVILYEGTDKEVKYIFPALLTNRGEGITIGSFQVK